MELLPAQRDTRLTRQRAPLNERTLEKHDAALIVCEREHAAALTRELPYASTWQRLYREAAARGPVKLLSARLSAAAIPIVIAFADTAAPAFERLTLAARAWKELGAPPKSRVLLATHGVAAGRREAALEPLVAAALAASAPLPTYKAKPPRPAAPAALVLLEQGAALDLARCQAIDEGNHLARWLTMLPPNILNSLSYRRALRELARQHRWQFSFLNEARLQQLQAGAFLAVSRANEHRQAGIVRLRYRAAPRRPAPPRLALVGKGICFDTGGINLKSHKSMYQMHQDMQGSAVAVGTLLALSRLQVPYDVDCWLAITENQIGAHAFRPQEVVRAANGVTIQVAHSDAEGRMVLADTLALAARDKPDLIVDFATLTGACVTALTERYAGAFTNRPHWQGALQTAGQRSGERVWPLPMDEDYDTDLESSIADVLQCTPDSKGDHILAARFLSRFVPSEVPWIHLDLAPGHRSGGLAHIPTDTTGFGVRYALQLLLAGEVLKAQPHPRKARMASRRSARMPS